MTDRLKEIEARARADADIKGKRTGYWLTDGFFTDFADLAAEIIKLRDSTLCDGCTELAMLLRERTKERDEWKARAHSLGDELILAVASREHPADCEDCWQCRSIHLLNEEP